MGPVASDSCSTTLAAPDPAAATLHSPILPLMAHTVLGIVIQ